MEEKGRGRDLRKKIGRKTNKKEENREVGKKKPRVVREGSRWV
jgi:hypothetical protein